MASHAQITQNNNFAISLQYLRKSVKVSMKADKHESFLYIDTIFFDGNGQASPKFQK